MDKLFSQNKYLQKYQLYIIPLIGLLITILLLIFLIIPQIQKLSKANEDLALLSQQQELLNKKITDLQQVNVEDIKNKYQISQLALPADKNIPSAVSQFQQIATQNNVELTSLGIAPGNPSGGTDYLLFKVEISGNLNQISVFLNSIKEGPRIMKVSSIEISGGLEGTYQASVSVFVYYQPAQNTLGNLEDPVTPLTPADQALLDDINNKSKTYSFLENGTSVPRGKLNPFD